MSTSLMLALIVIAAVLVVAAVLVATRRRSTSRPALKRRFGPEYDRSVADHDGDSKAAESELAERLKRHGSLRLRPLTPNERERYVGDWTAVQEHFVDSPRQAVSEADHLLGQLAEARGYPGDGPSDDQLDALSVHHGRHLGGYRRLHRAASTTTAASPDGPGGVMEESGTEEMREALIDARALFEDLIAHSTDRPARGSDRSQKPRHAARSGFRTKRTERHA